jgi:signal transduction histidine kinase
MIWTGILIGLAIGALIGVPVVWLELKRQVRRAKVAERRARRSQRMAEIGAMTGGLAHEIKNPLSTIGLNAQLLGEALGELEVPEHEKGRLVRRIDALRREADRLRDILQDFLQFAGEIHLDLSILDLNELVEELADFYLPQAQHHGVALRVELGSGPMRAQLDARQFKQALLNLMLNATQAMGTEGEPIENAKELIIRTEAGEPIHQDEGPSWRVHVIDTGPGMTPQTLEKVFTPYFTTKSGGSGLGLPTTKRLIEEHGGSIEVHSEPGQGTDFVIGVPRATGPDGT